MALQQKKFLSDDKAYAKRLTDALSGFYYPSLKWLQYILPDNDINSNLVEQTNIIWLYAMMESLGNTSAEIEEYETYAAASNNQAWLDACEQIRQNIRILRVFFNKFSKEEQVLIIFLRNYLVHGSLTKYNDITPMYWFENGKKINPDDRSWKTFKAMTQPLLGKNYNKTLKELLDKTVYSEFSDMFGTLSFSGVKKHLQNFERDIKEGLNLTEDDPFFSTWGN